MTSFRTCLKLVALTLILGMLGATITTGTASAAFIRSYNDQAVVTGSGSAGSGSLAVASFFDLKTSSGAGAFSGIINGLQASGLFSLTVSNPPFAPNLSCQSGEPQISAAGTIVSGSLLGNQVLVAGCVGKVVLVLIDVTPYHCIEGCTVYQGKGTGTVSASTGSLKAGFVAAGATSGSGSAGSGSVYTAEADAVTQGNSLLGGGAFVGRIGLSDVSGIELETEALIGPGCTLTTSGTTASFGSFPNQPVSSSYTLTACPPSSSGPQTAVFEYQQGGDLSPIYKGTGFATERHTVLPSTL